MILRLPTFLGRLDGVPPTSSSRYGNSSASVWKPLDETAV